MRREVIQIPEPPANDRPGDRWLCGRDDSQPPCAHGPLGNGLCPLVNACRPRRSWHGTRKYVATAAIAICVLVTFLMTRPTIAPEVFKPGELSTPHAQILSQSNASDRCAACHRPAALSPSSWFAAEREGHRGVTQSDRCLDCHHKSISRDRANLAHNLSASVLASIRSRIQLASATTGGSSWHNWMPGPAIDPQNVECAACHREHHGSAGNLLDVSDAQCQTCHNSRFGSFAQSHPNWDQWPYGRGGNIDFNHQSHATKHFPASNRAGPAISFDCGSCHRATGDGEVVRAPDYEHACKSCHDQTLQIEAAQGIDFVALPTIPREVSGTMLNWPEAATGFYDGQLAPLAELLMRSDQAAAIALRQLPPGGLGQVQPNQPQMTAAVTTLAREHQNLIAEIATRGQIAFLERAQRAGVSRALSLELIRSLPPQLLQQTYQQWFANPDEGPPPVPKDGPLGNHDLRSAGDLLAAEDDVLLADGNDLLGLDASEFDPLMAETTHAPEKPSDHRFDPHSMLPAGGWYRDDIRMAITYRGSGHSDPVLRAAVEMLAQMPGSDPVRKRWLATRAVAACVSCHPAAAQQAASWKAPSLIGGRDQFTKFKHGPHLQIAALADCRDCHQVATIDSASVSSITLTSGLGVTSMPIEFQPLARQTCANCHTAKAAGDNCTKCHRYHVDPR